ncbi:hypothetical protein AWB79_05238 [Caballeronia hypogeia]|uniref:ABC-type transport auxiliary lipoprotein component domain-containing protein n=1 Tax=Caballeronia hypogeia TaxID=1777140 RepID=A0A158CEK2_9BURK|nr:PqiC family protein [Caballeronia hypogeia]SAK80722.1 hypothetical protein AWB79_05238 [Caballeronia hypogeia]
MKRKIAAVIVASVLLHGCAHSPSTHYVTLNSVPAASAAAQPIQPIQPMQPMQPMQPVQLTALRIPAELDRPEVVTRPAPNRFVISDTDRWAAPLAQMMRLTLARDLQTRLPEGVFIFPGAPAPKDARALVVTVIDIGLPDEGELTLDVTWALVARNPEHFEFTRHVTLRAPLPDSSAEAKAAAMSVALGELAERIASSLKSR